LIEELQAYRQALLQAFEGQVEALRRAARARDGAAWHQPLEAGGWSAHQVLAHVRDTEVLAFMPRIERMLTENVPQLPNVDAEAWMAGHYDPDEAPEEMIEATAAARREAAARLQQAGTAGWSRTGIHPVRGERTVQWWVEYAVAHVAEHLEQIGAERPAAARP
jgi:uncharacterized damage-inducible protein DinB